MSGATQRTKLQIVTDLHAVTKQMLEQLDDPDFLIDAVDQRQDLMDEFDMLEISHPDLPALSPQETATIKQLLQEIMGFDISIATALENHKSESKNALATSNQQQKMMGYVNQSLSGSGSYMDFKE